MHPNEWPVVASSDLLYITDAAIFEDDPSFSKRTAGWHECPERYDERTCWSTSDSFVLFLTLPALLIHFPLLLCHLVLFMFFCLSLLFSLVINYLFLASFFLCNYVFILIFVLLSTFSDSHSISFPNFLCLDLLWWCVCCLVKQIFFCRVRVGLVGRGTEGSLFWTDCRSTSECLDRASVWFSVASQF